MLFDNKNRMNQHDKFKLFKKLYVKRRIEADTRNRKTIPLLKRCDTKLRRCSIVRSAEQYIHRLVGILKNIEEASE